MLRTGRKQSQTTTKQQPAFRNNCCVYCSINNVDESAAAHPHVVSYHVSLAPHSRLHSIHTTTACAIAARLRSAFDRTFFISGCSTKETAERPKAPTREAPFPTSVLQRRGGHLDEAPAKPNAHTIVLLTRCPRHRDLCWRDLDKL